MRKKTIWKIVAAFFAVALAVGIACIVYINDFYPANEMAQEALVSDEKVEITQLENGDYVFMPENPSAGLIFYPGGKVEHTAYAPLMRLYAEHGILCVLVKMPANLAVLDMNAAEGIPEQYPDIEKWYIGGHSLGGSMAASYVAKNMQEFEGILLLASYSTANIRQSDLEVLSVYGSEDGVLNMEKYEQYEENLPEDMQEKIIDGGCHAYFGSYGEQEGDGTAAISSLEQMKMTVEMSMETIFLP